MSNITDNALCKMTLNWHVIQIQKKICIIIIIIIIISWTYQLINVRYVCVVLHVDFKSDLFLQRDTNVTRTPNTSSTRTPAQTTGTLTEIKREGNSH